MNSKQKYLKYKQKYLNLKKMIGGGIDARYTISLPDKISILNYFDLFGIARKIKPGNILILKYLKEDGTTNEIRYNIIKKIGEGSYGIVYLIENIDTTKQYIFKYGKNKKGNDIYKECKDSDILKDILDDNMIPLFQGKKQSDFLISTYNGKNLYDEFKDKPEQIKNNYANITFKLLELLDKINSNNIFHNDIKLENITIKGDEVYLIDFGLLTKEKSDLGPIISMSYNGVIALLQEYNYTHYNDIFPKLNFVNNTDIVGFFYCCIDLLFLLNNSMYYSFKLLNELEIKNVEEENDVYILFNLFYFILPESKRTIPELNINSNYFNNFLPNKNITIQIFGTYPDGQTNLFRFMAYIYNKIKPSLNNETQYKWYIEFLRIMSDCFLPTFNYKDFKPQFENIVSRFSSL